jgi:CspA family cold shock protein
MLSLHKGAPLIWHACGADKQRFGPSKVVRKEYFAMSEGTVRWFNPRRGYGFISTADGRDIFVHYSGIASQGFKTLHEGDQVTFDVVEGQKGTRAENVVPKSAPVR